MINVINADCLDAMRAMDAASVDSIVTDPPYGLSFMGKGWDHGVPGAEFWREALRVAKPGAHLVAFGGTRTYHRLACAVEDAGWEVRDCLSWMYGTGFPKSKACLKPAWEPAILARKKGPGVLAIDECRIDSVTAADREAIAKAGGWARSGYIPPVGSTTILCGSADHKTGTTGAAEYHPAGRWPANALLDEEAAAALDAHAAGASRFFYTAKASKRERGEGNTHPTVKPLSLMQWVVRLVTPPGGLVLDPFAGSGTTGLAARAEGMRAILVEREAEYVEIINRRIAA